MDIPFLLIALVIAASALATISLPQVIHCGLCGALCFLATGALYLYLDAEFIGLVQLMVYVGAVAVLILFTILLTRPVRDPGEPPPTRRIPFWSGLLAGLSVTLVLGSLIVRSAAPVTAAAPVLKLDALGLSLATTQVVPLMVIALLLTSALIGAVVIAAPHTEDPS